MKIRKQKLIALLTVIPCVSASAGTFLTATIDGNFTEWASVPILDVDSGDNPGSVDFANIQIGNDDDFLYISMTYPNTLSNSTFISIDVDSNPLTGFDVFSLGLAGVEASWQNDFPFTNGTGSFNTGVGMSGDFFGSGAALISSTGDVAQKEWAISLDIIFNDVDSTPVFDDDEFTVLIWTDAGAGDVSVAIEYELAAVPEPSGTLLVSLAGMAFLIRRRR